MEAVIVALLICPCGSPLDLVAEWVHFTLFRDNITHSKTKSVHFWGLMNSATKKKLYKTRRFRN